MRFLVHSSNATYNAVTKRYTVQLDRRGSNPTQLEIVGCSYVASTADLYPLTVYLRSDWAQNLAKQKHTVELNAFLLFEQSSKRPRRGGKHFI